MSIYSIGIIGAGVMGSSLSLNLAQANHSVVLLDISSEILVQAREKIELNLRFQKFYSKDVPTYDRQAVLELMTFSTDYQLLKTVDFVIENVTEKWEIKKDVFIQIDDICHSKCIFASNTSAIPITKIAGLTKREEKVIGMHFMNPVVHKQAVEIVRGRRTSNETVEKAIDLLASMNKRPILVNDSPGFVLNRVLMLSINEAIALVEEGIASIEDVDRIFKLCLGHRMGPLETADLIGLDTVLNTLDVLHESFDDDKFRPNALLKKMVDTGYFGQKTNQGFYSYQLEGVKA